MNLDLAAAHIFLPLFLWAFGRGRGGGCFLSHLGMSSKSDDHLLLNTKHAPQE